MMVSTYFIEAAKSEITKGVFQMKDGNKWTETALKSILQNYIKVDRKNLIEFCGNENFEKAMIEKWILVAYGHTSDVIRLSAKGAKILAKHIIEKNVLNA